MQVYSLEHANFEDPVHITAWLSDHHIPVSHIRLFEYDTLPDPGTVGILLVMGGPMNIYEEGLYPWLPREKAFIRDVINLGKPVLGVCLGGQLLADLLGGVVTKSSHPEYGWHTIQRNSAFKDLPISHRLCLPETVEVFQWHQDTFSLPPGSIHLYSSVSCQNQAFMYTDRVIGLQFHPEMDRSTIQGFLTHSSDEIKNKGLTHIQEDILNRISLCSQGHDFIDTVLSYLLSLPTIPVPGSQVEPPPITSINENL